MLIVLGHFHIGDNTPFVTVNHALPDGCGFLPFSAAPPAACQIKLSPGSGHATAGKVIALPCFLRVMKPLQRHAHGEHVFLMGMGIRVFIQVRHGTEQGA